MIERAKNMLQSSKQMRRRTDRIIYTNMDGFDGCSLSQITYSTHSHCEQSKLFE